MKELRDITARAAQLRLDGKAAALATIVSASGSTYRPPGARMLVTASGETTGCVSGGCLEQDVIEQAQDILSNGTPRVVTYDSTAESDIIWGHGLGCQGVVQILIERVTPAETDVLSFVASTMARHGEAVVATVFGVEGECAARVGERLWMESGSDVVAGDLADIPLRRAIVCDMQTASGGTSEVRDYVVPHGRALVFLEVIAPPTSLVIFGAGHDAAPLVAQAFALGWHVTVVEHRAANLCRARAWDVASILISHPRELQARMRFAPRSAVVAMYHNYFDDLEAIAASMRAGVAYIGVLGPARRAARLLEALADRSELDPAVMSERVYGPVGIDIGADNPDDIALSIAAEIKAVLAGRRGGFLRDRDGAIHAGVASTSARIVTGARAGAVCPHHGHDASVRPI